MKRTIASLLILILIMSACAFAETVAPSVTVSQILVPTGNVEIADDFVVVLNTIAEDSAEKKVFDEIEAFVAEEPVADYFGEEVMTAAAEYLPEEFDTTALVVDEFFALSEENYAADYGDVTASFEFITPYEDGTVLLAMVGILPDEEVVTTEEGETEEAAITWIPQQAVVSEGKVQISFTQEILEMLKNNNCVCALLRADTAAEIEE